MLRTKKSRRLRIPYFDSAAPCPAPGITSMSKSLSARIKASTTCIVDAGSTFSSFSPTIKSSLPVKRWA